MSTSNRPFGERLISLGYEEAAGIIKEAEDRLAAARNEETSIIDAAKRAGNDVFDEKVSAAHEKANEIINGAQAQIAAALTKEKRIMTVYLTECALAVFLAVTGGLLAAYGHHELSNYIVSSLFAAVATTLLLHTHFRGPQSVTRSSPTHRAAALAKRNHAE